MFYVLTEAWAKRLGIVDADGDSVTHTATVAQIAERAESDHAFFTDAMHAAEAAGGDRYVIDESGDSNYIEPALKSVSGTNRDGSEWTMSVGDRVEITADASDEDSADAGKICSFRDQDTALVAWDSGVTTPAAVARLTHE